MRTFVSKGLRYAATGGIAAFVDAGGFMLLMGARLSVAVAASLSFGFFLIYWASLIGGEKLADRGIIPPWVGMWAANIVLGALGLYLTLRIGRETTTIDWNALRKFVPAFFRPPETTGAAERGGQP